MSEEVSFPTTILMVYPDQEYTCTLLDEEAKSCGQIKAVTMAVSRILNEAEAFQPTIVNYQAVEVFEDPVNLMLASINEEGSIDNYLDLPKSMNEQLACYLKAKHTPTGALTSGEFCRFLNKINPYEEKFEVSWAMKDYHSESGAISGETIAVINEETGMVQQFAIYLGEDLYLTKGHGKADPMMVLPLHQIFHGFGDGEVFTIIPKQGQLVH